MLDLFSQILKFMKVYQKFWLAPLIFGLLALGALLIAAQTSVFAPLIYALF